MSWLVAFQTFTAGLAAIGGYFIYDLIAEFKAFKSDTKTDVFNLKLERSNFQSTVRNAELSIGLRVNEIQKVHNDFTLEMKTTLLQFGNDTKNFTKFMQKSLDLCEHLNDRLKTQEQELKTLKIQLGEVMIFKSQKNGK